MDYPEKLPEEDRYWMKIIREYRVDGKYTALQGERICGAV